MSRFVRPSKYRHVYGQPAKDKYENLKVSASAWDTDLVKVSAKYLSLNWQASGGGAFAVVPLERTGKLPDLFPLCRAHSAPVLDTAWSPFNDSLVASCGEDGRVAITMVDDSVFDFADSNEIRDLEPISGGGAGSHQKMGHGRKAGNVLWNPVADSVLASASYEVKLWDVNAMACKAEMEHQPDMVQSMSFNYTGDGLATTCKDKKLRLFDTRSGGAPHTVAESHSGIKGSRVCWMGDLDRICTTGFSRMSDRQVFIWDSRNLTAGPVKTVTIDTSSGTLMPFFSAGNSILFFAGKGDGNVRYYEYENEELYPLSEYKSSEPQRGMTFLPARSVNVQDCEIARAFKVSAHSIEPISFIVPRKSDSFQSDIYPPALSNQPALSADEFFAGKTASPNLINMDDQSSAPAAPVRKSTAPPTANNSAAPSPAHTRSPTATSSADIPKTASTPIHPASSIKEAEGIVGGSSSPSSSEPTAAATATTTDPGPTASGNASPVVAASVPKTANGTHQDSNTKNGPAAGAAEVDTLQREIANLKQQIGERDQTIRKLELKVETLRTNAKKAREALSSE